MTVPIVNGDPILFMKVGTHANEALEEIIERKRREIRDAGFSMWGYGGNTCHPATMVQPFARSHAAAGRVIRLCMQPMQSRHLAAQVRADEYSVDGISWQPIPESINVLGSRYALFIEDLQPAEWDLPLDDTRVAVGRSQGRLGSAYIKGHVDKACLVVTGAGATGPTASIGLVATLREPYAVFLKN